MKINKLQELLGWALVINVILLLLVALAILMAHDWIYSIHSTFFSLSLETYDALLFSFLAIWKALVIVFVFIPYLSIRLISKK